MKNLLKKIQEKIYAIFHALKAYTSKLRISSFVGGQFKKWIVIKLLGEDFMIWNLKDYGDPLEKKALNFIETNGLGGYKNFWNDFVGNIEGNPARLEFSNEVLDNKRKLIAQWNYSILKNLFIIHKLQVDRYNKHKITKNNLNDIIHYDRDFILVTHLTYNNIELLDKIRNLIRNDSEETFYKDKYRDFINFRNLISHNIKPLTKHSYSYLVPKNFEWFIENGKDDTKLIWGVMTEIEYQPINDFFTWTIQTIITNFKDILTDEFTYCKKLFNTKQKNKIVDVPTSNVLKNKHKPLSGTTEQ
jgi:hypothetical protein